MSKIMGGFGIITTRDGVEAKVDADVAEKLQTRKFFLKRGQLCELGTRIPLAKMVMGLPKGLQHRIKFANGDKLDCRRGNLTVVSRGGPTIFNDLFEAQD